MSVKELILMYLYPFFFSWFAYCKVFLVAHPDFTDEYGWMAYQPFNFLVLVMSFGLMQFVKVGKKMRDKEIARWEGRKRCVIISMKLLITVMAGLAFYLIVLDGKPNLWISF